MKLNFFLFLSCFLSSICFSQTITGLVLDAKTNAPIESASVYFDNTTIGTSTNSKGEFEIEGKTGVTSDLIISFLGYEKVSISAYSDNSFHKILLQESTNALDEVIITSFDGMSRDLKLQYFREQFLGFSDAAKSCKILNEEDVILRFDEDTKQLSAYSKTPIRILNKNLHYEIAFEVQDFTINFSYVDVEQQYFRMKSVLFFGTSFYTNLSTTISRKIERNRKRAYKGSLIHFMRALSTQNLKREKYSIFSNRFKVKPEDYIAITKIDSHQMFKVKLKAPLSVLYKNDLQTEIISTTPRQHKKTPKFLSLKKGDTISVTKNFKLESNASAASAYNVEFYIDNYGNHSPIGSFYLIGYMGDLRVGDSLPLDYELGN